MRAHITPATSAAIAADLAAELQAAPQSVRDGLLSDPASLPLEFSEVRFEPTGCAEDGQPIGRAVLDVSLNVGRVRELVAAASAADRDAA